MPLPPDASAEELLEWTRSRTSRTEPAGDHRMTFSASVKPEPTGRVRTTVVETTTRRGLRDPIRTHRLRGSEHVPAADLVVVHGAIRIRKPQAARQPRPRRRRTVARARARAPDPDEPGPPKGRHHRDVALTGTHARELEALLALEPWSLCAVDRTVSGAGRYFVLRFRQQRFAGGSRRTFRIPAKRVTGYEQRSPTARPIDIAYRANENRRRFAIWLLSWLDVGAPIVNLALFDGDLGAIDDLRAAILLAADGGAEDADLWLGGWAA